MFHIYQKNGAWTLKGNEHLFFTTEEEAVNADRWPDGVAGIRYCC
jgi:hypothetical protein